MIAAVDTNILIDIPAANKKHFADSKNVIDKYIGKGQLIISEVVYAELLLLRDRGFNKTYFKDVDVKNKI